MNLDFPYHFDTRGHSATSGDADHIRDMIEQFLFTNPGERVNRSDFGSGLLQMVFAPNGSELAAVLQFTVQAGLQGWMGDLIDVQALEVHTEDTTLQIDLRYTVRASGELRTESFVRRAS